jgi:hypothetical protein
MPNLTINVIQAGIVKQVVTIPIPPRTRDFSLTLNLPAEGVSDCSLDFPEIRVATPRFSVAPDTPAHTQDAPRSKEHD